MSSQTIQSLANMILDKSKVLTPEREAAFLAFIEQEMTQDLAHDLQHVLRVVKTAKQLCKEEGGIPEIVIPAAYLHDCFSFGKGHPKRRQSSLHAADKAQAFLENIGYPKQYLTGIHHAIVAHSFSANVETSTLEAKIVQDADRLDALGAIGIARCLQVSVTLNRPLYSPDDPFCETREPDDGEFTLDHLYTKLLKLENTMKTAAAQKEAKRRTVFMQSYLAQLAEEIA
ncbi:HD domain-containing protein [Enterovibrio norvegicus]|uniref:HD domain-containing protein n=1 Tax=Enterovibrio norvegicus TaxID=188144 RepID=UPI0013D125B5